MLYTTSISVFLQDTEYLPLILVPGDGSLFQCQCGCRSGVDNWEGFQE